MEENKVFCKECKYYWLRVTSGLGVMDYTTFYTNLCTRDRKTILNAVDRSKTVYEYEECEDKNRNNNCRDFEQKEYNEVKPKSLLARLSDFFNC